MIHNLRAVVLWSRRHREADKVVGLYTDRLGRVTARARSAARSGAKFAALTEPFMEGEIALHLRLGAAWGKLVGGRLLNGYPGLRTDLAKSTAASWVCEIVFRLTPEEQPSAEKYSLLRGTLSAIEQEADLGAIRLAFAVRFLRLAGLGLDHREAWIDFERAHPDWARDLREAPLTQLADRRWKSDRIVPLERLAGSVVYDHLNRPLAVNRFRQLTGVEI